MMDDLAGRTTGERVRTIRERRGMTRPVVAGLVGRSAEWLKAIECGRRLPPRLPLLVRLAEVLGVSDVAHLVGTDMDVDVSLPLTSFRRIPHESVPAIREAIHAPHLAPATHEVDVSAVLSRTADAWRLWHSSPTHRTDVGRVLPALLRDARIAASTTEGQQRRAVSAALAEVYILAQHLVAYASEGELVWLAADRALSAAQAVDRPEALAGAAWVVGVVRRSVGDYDGALELIQEAVDVVRPYLDTGTDDLRGLWGALHLHGALTAARAGREGDAWRYWDEGDATADRLANYTHPWTQFGRANVDIHGVSISADLCRGSSARDLAQNIDPDTIPSLERRSRLMVEIARGYHQQRDYSAALTWLRNAHTISTESVHYSPSARQVASDVIDHGGPLVDRDARAFGQTLGLPV